jgi:hypothetical protein
VAALGRERSPKLNDYKGSTAVSARFARCRQLALKRRSIELADWSACWGKGDIPQLAVRLVQGHQPSPRLNDHESSTAVDEYPSRGVLCLGLLGNVTGIIGRPAPISRFGRSGVRTSSKGLIELTSHCNNHSLPRPAYPKERAFRRPTRPLNAFYS